MLTRVVSRASVSLSGRRVARSRKAVASRSWNRFVQTTAEDTTGLPEPPKTMKGIPTSAFEILNGMPEEQVGRRVYIYRPARNAMQSGSRVRSLWHKTLMPVFSNMLSIVFATYFSLWLVFNFASYAGKQRATRSSKRLSKIVFSLCLAPIMILLFPCCKIVIFCEILLIGIGNFECLVWRFFTAFPFFFRFSLRRILLFAWLSKYIPVSLQKVDQWFLQFERSEDRWNNPIMGWVSSRDPLGQMTMKFPDRDSAVRYAEAHGSLKFHSVVAVFRFRFLTPLCSFADQVWSIILRMIGWKRLRLLVKSERTTEISSSTRPSRPTRRLTSKTSKQDHLVS